MLLRADQVICPYLVRSLLHHLWRTVWRQGSLVLGGRCLRSGLRVFSDALFYYLYVRLRFLIIIIVITRAVTMSPRATLHRALLLLRINLDGFPWLIRLSIIHSIDLLWLLFLLLRSVPNGHLHLLLRAEAIIITWWLCLGCHLATTRLQMHHVVCLLDHCGQLVSLVAANHFVLNVGYFIGGVVWDIVAWGARGVIALLGAKCVIIKFATVFVLGESSFELRFDLRLLRCWNWDLLRLGDLLGFLPLTLYFSSFWEHTERVFI